MTAKLQGRRAGTLEVRKIVCEHIGEALTALDRARPSDASIHKARKAIKKARAAWRLLRPTLPKAAYREANDCLREAGRPLGVARDAKILVVALDRLLANAQGSATVTPLRTFRRTILKQGTQTKRAVRRAPAGLALSRHALRSAQQRIQGSAIGKHGWSSLGEGLRRVYRRGRRMYHKARSDRRTEHLHEWRKEAKYLHHQLTVFKPLWKGPIGKLSGEAADLADKLGDDHDLVILCARLHSTGARLRAGTQRKVVTLIEQERERLQDAAFMLGARIYEEKPADFYARFGGYWQEWCHPEKSPRQEF
jgi:CHAD domain-containing protein